MSDARQLLRHRLIGAAAVFAGIFLLSLLLPGPDDAPLPPDGAVLIPLVEPPDDDAALVSAPEIGADAVPAEDAVGRARVDEPEAPTEARREATPAAPAPEAAPVPEPVAPAPEPAAPSAPPPAATPEPRQEAEAEPPATPRPEPPRVADGDGTQPGPWWIQAASYSSREAAERGAGLLDDAGIRNRLHEVTVNGRRIWRLQAGPFNREDEARMWRDVVEDRGFAGARVLRRDGE